MLDRESWRQLVDLVLGDVLGLLLFLLVRMLLIAVGAAIAVPANATIRAVIATIIAGDGRRPFELVIETPLLVVGPRPDYASSLV
jgi:hypothetical protein